MSNNFFSKLLLNLLKKRGTEPLTDSSPIITNRALEKMKQYNLSEAKVLDAFNKGKTEIAGAGGRWNAIRVYNGYEIGVNYDRNPDGRYVIISLWVRGRR